jgi:hypothetical protein
MHDHVMQTVFVICMMKPLLPLPTCCVVRATICSSASSCRVRVKRRARCSRRKRAEAAAGWWLSWEGF